MKANISLAVFCLLNSSTDATFVQKNLVPIWAKQQELNQIHEQMNFKHKNKSIPQAMTEANLKKQAEHYRTF